jgi:hypothetical protein
LTVALDGGHHRVRLVNADFHLDESTDVLIQPQKIVRRRFRFPVATARSR